MAIDEFQEEEEDIVNADVGDDRCASQYVRWCIHA
jgi:hypothetical protein